VDDKKFITTQTDLAVAVGVAPEHLSAIKNRRYSPSEDLVQNLARITGIRPYTILVASTKQLDGHFKKFFEVEKARRLVARHDAARLAAFDRFDEAAAQ